MAIQNRRGNYTDFDPTKMVAGEFAVVQSGDEHTDDGKALYIATTTGSVKRIPFAEELEDLVEVDDTLTITGAAADAKKTGDEITSLKDDLSQIFSTGAKAALLACFAKVAWIDEHGQDYYDALEAALNESGYPRITASFNSGSTIIYTDNTLNSLKQYLTVKYYESKEDSGSEISSEYYQLSGQLNEGINSITVTYDDCSSSFTVNVVSALDKIAYGTLTYRDIFIDGNYFTLQGFENIDVVPSVETSLPNGDTFYGSFGNPLPSIDTEHVKSGTHSLKASGTTSSQVKYTTLRLPIEGRVLVACNVYVNRYVKGLCGVQFNARTDSSHATTKNAGVSQTTNDFVTAMTVQDYDLSEGSQSTVTTEIYCGTWSSANADVYVDDVVVSIVPAEMTLEIATQLYNNYLNMI